MKLYGRAQISGTQKVNGTNAAFTWTGIATATTDSIITGTSFTDNATIQQNMDANGSRCGSSATDEVYKMTISFDPVAKIPGSGPSLYVDANNSLELPPRNSKVTLSGFPENTTTGPNLFQINTDWIYYEGGTIALDAKQVARMTLPLELPKNLSTGVSVTTLTTAVG